MHRINYKSDFKLREETKNIDTSVPFKFTYKTWSEPFFIASFDGHTYTNCKRMPDGKLMVIFNDHKLKPGKLLVMREYFLSDKDFSDGECHHVSYEDTGIELSLGKSDKIDVTIQVYPNYQKGEKGDKLTFKDLTPEDIAQLQKPASDAAIIAENSASKADTATEKALASVKLANDATKSATEQADRARTEADRMLAFTTSINVSNAYPTGSPNQSNIYTLESAINVIEERYRTVGLKCSFLTSSKEIEEYQYVGGEYQDVSLWVRTDAKSLDNRRNEIDTARKDALQAIGNKEQAAIGNFSAQRVTPEMLSESTKQFINASGGGSITNMPDDEDMTVVGDVMKFADREYNPAVHSGKGRKILRKNIVNGKNILTQDMLSKANTVYVIRYDYQLNGVTLKVPSKCTLYFDGGSIGEGNIVFADTMFLGDLDNIFSLGALNDNGDSQYNLTGSIKNRKLSLDWFVANNDADALQHALNCSNNLAVPLVLGNKKYNIKHTIFLPNFVCVFGNSYHPNLYGGNGVNNTSILKFSCRYLFMPKKRIKGDGQMQSDSERFFNDIKMFLLNVTILGEYSCPKYPAVGYHEGHALQPYNGDPYWIRKTYVFFGGDYNGSRIEGVHANYIGTFLYGSLSGTSVIQHCAIFFSRFFIANFVMVTKDSAQNLNIEVSIEKEIGSSTKCAYGGNSYIGYEEEYLGANKEFNAIVDSRIQDNYISSNKWRGIAFYDCKFSHSNVVNNFIEFCFIAFYNLQNETTNICNNILDYNFINFSGMFYNTRIVSNTIYKCHSDNIFKVQGLFVYPWNDVYTDASDYCKLIADAKKATTFFPYSGWFGIRNMIISDNYCHTGERFLYYMNPIQRTKHLFVERNVLDNYDEEWAAPFGLQVYTGNDSPIENDCTDIHIQFWDYREYNDHNEFPELAIRPLDTSGKTMVFQENSVLFDRTNNILYKVCGEKLVPINVFMANNKYGCGGTFSTCSDGGFVFNDFNKQFSFMKRPENINYLSDGKINWSTSGEIRPNEKSIKEGFTFYDSTLKKMILFNGTDWVNLDGSTLK